MTNTDSPRFFRWIIMYLWTREGWLYRAVILDLFSRRVVGWLMSALTRQLTLDALAAAFGQRAPHLGLLHHSRRNQYASGNY